MIQFALAFVFGAFCLQQMPVLPSLYWAFLLVPFAFLSFKFLHTRQNTLAAFKPALLIASAFLLGFFWAAACATIRLADALPHAWEDKPIKIVGVVSSISELTEHGERFRFDVEKTLTAAAQVSWPKAQQPRIQRPKVPRHISLSYYPPGSWGNASAPASGRAAQFRAGERWQLTVRLKRPHGTQNPHGFDFESWALAENIRATGTVKTKADNRKVQSFVWRPGYCIEHVRESIRQRIDGALLNKPYGGIIQALVIGDDSQIAADDWQLFLRTGTSHLMSISGLHVTMLSGLAFALVGFVWRRVPQLVSRLATRKAAAAAGVAAAFAYALVSGFSVPTQRTLYMLMIFAGALWSGRQFVISQVLALALFAVVLMDPWSVISAGFWLSFGAVAVLSFAMGARVGPIHWLKASIKTQWAVTIGMLPLILMLFHQASVVSPLANAVAIPVISFLVTPLALLGSFLHIDAVLNAAYFILDVCMQLLKWMNQLPDAVWQQHAPALWTLIPALAGVIWLLLPRGVPLRWMGCLGLLPMLFIAPPRPAMGGMKVAVLDVGQGLSVVVQTTSHTLLYDAGRKFSEHSDAGGRVVVPYLQGEGVRRLDGFIVSHNDTDHSGGMASVLSMMPVDWLASSMPDDAEPAAGAVRMKCFAGQRWSWDGVAFEMLHPQPESYDELAVKDNDRSCVLKINSAAGSLLLTGDIQKEAEWQLAAASGTALLKSDAVVVPHHGSSSSSGNEFLAAVQPRIAIFTSGYFNRFRHPRPEIVARYQAIGAVIQRSDYHGAVIMDFVADAGGGGIKLSNWRNDNKRYWHDIYP